MATGVELEVKRVTRVDGKGATKAFCDVAINGSYLIKGLKVVDGKNGLFVSMPREQGRNGQWYDTFLPLTPTAKGQLSDTVLEAFGAPEPAME